MGESDSYIRSLVLNMLIKWAKSPSQKRPYIRRRILCCQNYILLLRGQTNKRLPLLGALIGGITFVKVWKLWYYPHFFWKCQKVFLIENVKKRIISFKISCSFGLNRLQLRKYVFSLLKRSYWKESHPNPHSGKCWNLLKVLQCWEMLTKKCWQRNVAKEMLQGRRQWGRASLVGFSELLDKWCQIYQGPKTLYFANTNGSRFFKVMQPTWILHPANSIALFTNICEYIWIGR